MNEDLREHSYFSRGTITLASMQVLVPTAPSPVDLLLSEEEGREKVTTKDRSWRLGRLRVFELKGGAVVVIELNRKFKLYPSASNNQ